MAEAGGPYTVDEGGTVQLHGTVSDSPGVLEIEIAQTANGPVFDQLDVTGNVTLGGMLQVSLIGGFGPDIGQSFTIVNNDLSDAVAGFFAGLPEGAIFTADGACFQISYRGLDGLGNDVVLKVVEPTTSAPPDSLPGFAWDLDADGEFDDAVGSSPIFSAAGLDGPGDREVAVRLTDAAGYMSVDTAAITINNVAPAFDAGPDAILEPPAEGVLSRTINFTDPGPDVWTGTVNWGDGSGGHSS